jgi:hypothetical protein
MILHAPHEILDWFFRTLNHRSIETAERTVGRVTGRQEIGGIM